MILPGGPEWLRCDVCGRIEAFTWPLPGVPIVPAGWTQTVSNLGPGLRPDVCWTQDQSHAVARALAIIVAVPIGLGVADAPV